jgi:hypothetical protein
MTWGKFRQMTAKEYREISDITYKIQDLADKLLKFESTLEDSFKPFADEHKALYDIAQGIQDYRDSESGSLTQKQIEEA